MISDMSKVWAKYDMSMMFALSVMPIFQKFPEIRNFENSAENFQKILGIENVKILLKIAEMHWVLTDID